MAEKSSPEDIERRTYAAWFHNRKATGKPQPDTFELMDLNGLIYAVLARGPVTLAVYRVRNSGQLKYLVKPPSQFRMSE